MKHETLHPEHLGGQAGDARVFVVQSVFAQRTPAQLDRVTVNMTSGHRISLFPGAGDTAPFIQAFGPDHCRWLGQKIRIRLRENITDRSRVYVAAEVFEIRPIQPAADAVAALWGQP